MADDDLGKKTLTSEQLRTQILLITFEAYQKGTLPLQIPDYAQALGLEDEEAGIRISNAIGYLFNRGYIDAREVRAMGRPYSLWAVVNLLPSGVDAAEAYVARSAKHESRSTAESERIVAKTDEPVAIEPANKNKVFVVHGRDLQFASAMSDFLRSLGLEVISWLDGVRLTGKATPYLNEVIEVALRVAQAIVILMTPDNEARLHKRLWDENTGEEEKEYKFYPRQNVVYEAGMAFGLARDRAIIVKPRDVILATDLEGLNYQGFNADAESRNQLASRLEIAGCTVSRTGDWLHSGAFPDYRNLKSEPPTTPPHATVPSEAELTRRFSVQPTLLLSLGGSVSGPEGFFLLGEIRNVGRGVARDVRLKLPELGAGRIAGHILVDDKVPLRYRYDDKPCFTASLGDSNVIVEFEDELGTLYRQAGEVVQEVTPGGVIYTYSVPTIGPPTPIAARTISV